jgi:methionyl-tRNA formyltransferase
MKLVAKLDAGDILLQAKTALSLDDTAGTLHDRLAQMGAELIVPTLRGLADGTLVGRSQDESQVVYAAKLTKEMEQLDPSLSAVELERRVRALNPWPGTSLFVKLGGEKRERLKVRRARALPSVKGPPGQLFEHDGGLALATSEGALAILAGQWDGKKETDGVSLRNGLHGRGLAFPLGLEWNTDATRSEKT